MQKIRVPSNHGLNGPCAKPYIFPFFHQILNSEVLKVINQVKFLKFSISRNISACDQHKFIFNQCLLPEDIFPSTICPRSSDPFYIVSYCIKWVTTSWTHVANAEYISNLSM